MDQINTKLLSGSDNDISIAAKIINNGGLVAIPTETVYGLAADALNPKAVLNIFKAKGRPNDNPLIVHISELSQIQELTSDFNEKAQLIAKSFWPGPITIILPKTNIVPLCVTGGLDTVAIRMPSHPIARKLISKSGKPLAAPSANTAGKPSPTTANHVINDLNNKIDAIIDGGQCDVGLESTVITLALDKPRLLRPGKVTVDEIQNVIGEIDIDPAVIDRLKEGTKVSSPGMKYKHYSPKARVILIKGNKEQYIKYVNDHSSKNVAAICFNGEESLLKNVKSFPFGDEKDYKTQANLLFDILRQIDKSDNIDLVYSRCPEPKGIGLAVYNRLIRAAGFEMINLA